MPIRDIFLISCLITLNLLAACAWGTLADMKSKLEDIDQKLSDIRREALSFNCGSDEAESAEG
jgi:hypothetical protein